MEEYDVARAWSDARVTKIWAGSNEIMKELIGRSDRTPFGGGAPARLEASSAAATMTGSFAGGPQPSAHATFAT
jgi:hypothetical protein